MITSYDLVDLKTAAYGYLEANLDNEDFDATVELAAIAHYLDYVNTYHVYREDATITELLPKEIEENE